MVYYTKRPDSGIRCIVCGQQPNFNEDRGIYLCPICWIEDQRAYVDLKVIQKLKDLGEQQLTGMKIMADEISLACGLFLDSEAVLGTEIEIVVKKSEKLAEVGRSLLDSL